MADQHLTFEGRILNDDSKTLEQEHILTDEVLVLQSRRLLALAPDANAFPGTYSSNLPDANDVEIQKKIEQEIRQQNIQNNLAVAYDDHPETFTSVSMLYISCLVNGHPVKAFVDCGAQVTICS